MTAPPTPRRTLGVPMLPPPVLGEAVTRMRALVDRLHRRMAPPPVQILESALALLDHRVLVVLCDVDVPDHLTGPMTVDELAERTTADPVQLARLVRFAATRGWLDQDRRGRVRPNGVTTFLRRDHPAGWRAWVDLVALEAVVDAVAVLDLSGADTFAAHHDGRPFFTWMRDHPSAWADFDGAMAAGGRMHALTLDAAIDWGGTRSLCDVGGGTGDLLSSLLDLHPDWTGAVLDLPDVVDRAVTHPRMQVIGGDAFTSIPDGFDLYLLVNVLHDWGDEDVAQILGNVAAALDPGSSLVVVDNRRRSRPIDELAVRADVLMAALTSGGRERGADELAALGSRSGLALERTVALASGDLAHRLVLNAASS